MPNVLISQKEPSNPAPYAELDAEYGAKCSFRPFYKIEPLEPKEFRAQKINLQDYSAIVFSSRFAIDAYFMFCEDARIRVPETMKYFCTTEVVAMYLQKHIVYRKRKIFFGNGTPESLVRLIGPKHKGEKFLVATSENANNEALTSLLDKSGLDYSTAVLVKPVTQDLKDIDFSKFDVAVLYNPYDVKALYENFPDFKQGNLRFVTFGKSIVGAMESAGLQISVSGPTPEVPSAVKALEICLSSIK